MYPVTATYKTKIKELERVFQARIQIQHSQGVLNLTDKDIALGSLIYNEASQAGEDFTIGGVVASDLTVNIVNKPEYANLQFVGATLTASIGLQLAEDKWELQEVEPDTWEEVQVSEEAWEWVPLGVFHIDEIGKTRNVIRVKAIDAMINLDIPYSLSQLVYPATLLQIFTNICNVCDIQQGSYTFPNSEHVVKDRPDVDSTFRDILAYVAELSGTFARTTRTGALELVWYEESGLTLTGANRFDFVPRDDVIRISGITATVDGVTYIAGGGVETEIYTESGEDFATGELDGVVATVGGLKLPHLPNAINAWAFNRDWTDAIGEYDLTNNGLTLESGSPYDTEMAQNSSWGNSNRAAVDGPLQNRGDLESVNGWTIAFSAKVLSSPMSFPKGYCYIWTLGGLYSSGSGNGIGIRMSPGPAFQFLQQKTGGSQTIVSKEISLSTWYRVHLVGNTDHTVDCYCSSQGGTLTFVGTLNTDNWFGNNSDEFRVLGGTSAGSSTYDKGSHANVEFLVLYDKALSGAELQGDIDRTTDIDLVLPLGRRTALPQDLSFLGANPDLRMAWQATEPEGTSVKVLTAVTEEISYTNEPMGIGINYWDDPFVDIEIGNTTGSYSSMTYPNWLFGVNRDFKGKMRLEAFHPDGWQGSGAAEFGSVDDSNGSNYTVIDTQTITQYDKEVEFEVELVAGNYYVVRHNADTCRNTTYARPGGDVVNLLKAHESTIGLNNPNVTPGFARMELEEHIVENTFYLPACPAEKYDDLVIKVDGVQTIEFTRPDANNPKKIVFNDGHEPGDTLAVTTTFTGVTEPSETAEVQTLYLGGATGGTFTLGDGTTDTDPIAYDATVADIEAELEAIFGTGRVTVEADTDFTITFHAIIRNSNLIADFANLTGATDPALTLDTSYNTGDWEEQTKEITITNLPSNFTGKWLWIKEILETSDPSITPLLESLELYSRTEGGADYLVDLSSNPLLQSDYETVLATIYNAVKGVSFYPFASSWQGDPAVQAGDIITQIDRDGKSYKTLATHSTYKYRGASTLQGKGLPVKAKGYKGSTNRKFAEIIRKIDEVVGDKLTTLEQAQLHATEMIANMLGGHAIFTDEAIYIADSEDLDEAVKVWKWGLGGFGYSSTGVEGPYTTAITADGTIVAMLVAAGIVTADMIQTGVLQSQDGSSWFNLGNGTFNLKGMLKWMNNLLTMNQPDDAARLLVGPNVFAMQAYNELEEEWQNKIYFDPVRGKYIFDGLLSADAIQAVAAVIDYVVSDITFTQILYAEKGNISELTVDQLDTSTMVAKYLNSDTSNVDYIKIWGQHIHWIEGVVKDGAPTVQLTDRKGNPLYWVDEESIGMYTTFEETDYPVVVYEYDLNPKLKMDFELDPVTGYNVPIMTWGMGSDPTGQTNKGKGYIYKDETGLIFRYINEYNETFDLRIGEDGIQVSGIDAAPASKSQVRNTFVSTDAPDDSSGEDGDVWLMYQDTGGGEG